jgi:glycosyltransferase involved in cell wall biosynthesis
LLRPPQLGGPGLGADGFGHERHTLIGAEGALELLLQLRVRLDRDDARACSQEECSAIADMRSDIEREVAGTDELAVERDARSGAPRDADPVPEVRETHHPTLSSAVVAATARAFVWRARLERDAALARVRPIDLALFHDFAPAPAGGAHQSLRALTQELQRRGVRVVNNTLAPSTRAVLFNSFNFDFDRLRVLARRTRDTRLVHRVGAVTSLYRGFDDGTDARVAGINAELAHATLAISHATIDMYRSIGIELVDPHVVHNPCDDRIFTSSGREPFRRDRKTRLIATSWSDNPRKGGATYAWLEEHLDWDRFDFTFVGNIASPLRRARCLAPVSSSKLASVLREHDVYVTATEHDAYSNALVEALSCGLPAVYLDSGGSAEAVKEGGFGFTDREQIPDLLDRIVDEYELRQARIALPPLAEIADGYLAVLGLDEYVGVRAV